MTPALRVAVLVDLPWRENAGGHVKTWQRLARAAANRTDVQLDVHALGDAPATSVLADNVRVVLHRPIWSTSRLPFVSAPDHTDLAPHHRSLGRALIGYDVLHTTSAYFAFAATAERASTRTGAPLVHSIHTDTPAYARVYTEQTVERCLGTGRLRKLVLERFGAAERAESRMRRRLLAHVRRCGFVFANRAEDRDAACEEVGPARVGTLRRGVERELFARGGRSDRAWLQDSFGVPADGVVILCVGRVDAGKNVAALARAVRSLVETGVPAHLLCVGDGPDRAMILSLLGARATCPGFVAPETLARIYNCADVFAHPSSIEITSNVVLEALTSGLPAVVTGTTASGLADAGAEGFVAAEPDPAGLARALLDLAGDELRRKRIGASAAAWAARALPSWCDVLERDLLSVWHRVARTRGPEP